MNPIKVILADDEQESLEILKNFLTHTPDFHLIGLCENGEELVEQVMLKKPDLVITDIKMPKKNGIEAMKECRGFYPHLKFVFITGSDEFAVEAFEIAAVDYIIKPVERGRLFEAFEKAKDMICFEQGKLDPPYITKAKMNVLPLKGVNYTVFIPLEDIYFIEKAGKKCLVYTKREIYETNETMGKILLRLDGDFFQTHRSYIINLQKIMRITQRSETFVAYFKDYDKQAGISKLKINEVRDRISL